MTRLAWEEQVAPRATVDRAPLFKTFMLQDYSFLLYLSVLAAELFLPILIWKTPIPGAARWLGDMGVFLVLLFTFSQMLIRDRIPQLVILLVGYTAIGTAVAIFEGQTTAATIWGWWMLFKYPVFALFVYIQKEWPSELAGWFWRASLAILSLQVFLQLLQYATGETPGDNLAGTFGTHGVMPLFNFLFIILSLAFGHWLVHGNWRLLVYVLLVATIASVLGSMRIYFIFMPVFSLLALMLHLLRGGKIQSLLLYLLLLGTLVPSFIYTYNTVVAEPRGLKRFEAFLSDDSGLEYFDNANYDSDSDRYRLGRNFSIIYAWQTLQRDPVTLLFGYGIGARGDSSALGIAGTAFTAGPYKNAAGTSGLVLIQELGLFGLGLLIGVLLWFIRVFWRCGSSNRPAALRVLAYGLLIYTCGWPLWVWYNNSWRFGASMILYWGLCGYVLQQSLATNTARSAPPLTAPQLTATQ